MASRLHLVDVPLLNSGVVFNESELNARVHLLLKEIKTLIPQISSFRNLDLVYEMVVCEKYLQLSIYLMELTQSSLGFTRETPLIEIKELILKDLNWLPIKLNLLALQSQSINPNYFPIQQESGEEHFKKLMRKRQKSVLRFLLDGIELNLSFPEMAPYKIDDRVRSLEFKIEYIHTHHLRIKLLSDSLGNEKIKKTVFLRARNKISDDDFYKRCTESLRPKKTMRCQAISYIDYLSNEILAFEAI